MIYSVKIWWYMDDELVVDHDLYFAEDNISLMKKIDTDYGRDGIEKYEIEIISDKESIAVTDEIVEKIKENIV